MNTARTQRGGSTESSPSESDHSLRAIVEDLADTTDRSTVSMRDMTDTLGVRSFLPMMMVPALLVVSPLSGIPLLSSICGLTIATVAGQMLVGRSTIWLPDFIMRRQIDGDRARSAMTWVCKVAELVDRYSRRRFGPLMKPPLRKWIQVLCLVCGLFMPVLEIVPFSSSLLGLAVLFLGNALLTRDGLFAMLGVLAMGAAMILPLTAINLL